MADVVDIGGAASQVKSSDLFAPFTQVILKNDSYDAAESTEYTVGSTTNGRSLTVQCPWADETIASKILAELDGTTYQPYTANGAVLDPSVELGDDLSVMGLTGRIFAQDISFGGVMRSNIGAPGEEEIDHEFHFEVKRERKLSRAFTAAGAGIRKAQELGFEANAGLDSITGWEVDEEGHKTGRYIAESALYATILNETGEFKEARISASVVRDADGNLRSLAAICADAIILEGKVDVLGNLSVNGGYLVVNQGSLWVPNGIVSVGGGSVESPSAINYLTCVNAYATTMRVGGGGIVFPGESAETYVPQDLTSATGPVRVLARI